MRSLFDSYMLVCQEPQVKIQLRKYNEIKSMAMSIH